MLHVVAAGGFLGSRDDEDNSHGDDDDDDDDGGCDEEEKDNAKPRHSQTNHHKFSTPDHYPRTETPRTTPVAIARASPSTSETTSRGRGDGGRRSTNFFRTAQRAGSKAPADQPSHHQYRACSAAQLCLTASVRGLFSYVIILQRLHSSPVLLSSCLLLRPRSKHRAARSHTSPQPSTALFIRLMDMLR